MGTNDNNPDVRLPLVFKMHGRIPFYLGIGMGLLAIIDGLIAIVTCGLYIGCLRAKAAQALLARHKAQAEMRMVNLTYNGIRDGSS